MANLPGSSSDCLSHVRREASTWTNDDLLQFIWTLSCTVHWKFHRSIIIFFKDNAFQDVVCKMSTILFRLQSLDSFVVRFKPCVLSRIVATVTAYTYCIPYLLLFSHDVRCGLGVYRTKIDRKNLALADWNQNQNCLRRRFRHRPERLQPFCRLHPENAYSFMLI